VDEWINALVIIMLEPCLGNKANIRFQRWEGRAIE
jgi:hypothetical protein